jgi:hypothetical protein
MPSRFEMTVLPAASIASPRRGAKLVTLLACLAAWSLLSGCVYRFTNEHIVRPEGIRTVAVEAIWDTSREVIPHEVLWQALQDAFAADGNLLLVSQRHADALVRAHIKDARVGGAGPIRDLGPKKDPKVTDPNDPPGPGDFRQLTRAGQIREDGVVAMLVDVEVWSLRTRTLLMRKTYPVSDTFRAAYAIGSTTVPSNDFLRYQESLDARVLAMSQSIAQQVVQTLLVP